MKKLLLPIIAASVSLAYQTSAPRVQSPEVQNDGRVTFRYLDPDARKVTVSLEGSKAPYVMQKNPQGIWTFTTEVLPPDLYSYSFEADGVRRLDPENTEIQPNLLDLSNVVHVPGSAPLPWEDSDIPHGRVHHHFYKSAVVGDNRDFYVYTPPGYDGRAATAYPVLYLLHGYSDDASGWTAVGKANLILDALISEKRAQPMIVVMPLGYGAPEIVKPSAASPHPFAHAELREKNFSNFQAALIDEVIPLVEGAYRVEANRDARAIAGLSMGGAESLLTGLNHLDKFSWVGGFSSGGLNSDFSTAFPQLTSSANDKLHLLWISCGTDDHLITANRNLIAWLQAKGIHLTPVETPGMHNWGVWRRNLIAFAPLLFRADTTTPSSAAASR